MTELEGVKSWSQGSRRRLGLLDGLGLVSWALLVTALSSMVSSSASTTLLTITLLLFEGWLIQPALDSAQLLSLVLRGGGLSSFSLLPGKSYGLAYV